MRTDITAATVKEAINGYKRITVEELAGVMNCGTRTIRNRLGKLRSDGEPVFFDKDGLYIVDADDEYPKEDMKAYFNYIHGIATGLARTAKPAMTKENLIAMRAAMKELTSDERKEFTAAIRPVLAICQKMDIDEILDEGAE